MARRHGLPMARRPGAGKVFQAASEQQELSLRADIGLMAQPQRDRAYVLQPGVKVQQKDCRTPESWTTARGMQVRKFSARNAGQQKAGRPVRTSGQEEAESGSLAPPHPDGALFGKQLALDLELPAPVSALEMSRPSTVDSGAVTRFHTDSQWRHHAGKIGGDRTGMFMAPPHPDGALFGKSLSLNMDLPRGLVFGEHRAAASAPLPQQHFYDEAMMTMMEPLQRPFTVPALSRGTGERPPSRGSRDRTSRSLGSLVGRAQSQQQPWRNDDGTLCGFGKSKSLGSLQPLEFDGSSMKEVKEFGPMTTKWLATKPMQARHRWTSSNWNVSGGGLVLTSVAE
jgi:hypothetical protein